MKLKKAWETRDSASGTASALVRQLALAGIAVVWLLSGGLQDTGIDLTTRLLAAGLALILALFLDFLQYVVTSAIWGPWVRRKEKEAQGWTTSNHQAWDKTMVLDEEKCDIGEVPDWFNRPTWCFWGLKVCAMVTAYVLILIDLADRIKLH